ncbi:MAG: transposase [Chloroflexi bacterium]|nr:transposase [Chloroflexota bacterium]
MNNQSRDTFYRRNLPHIHLEGYPLFITFNLADAIPNNIIAELKAQRERELLASPENSEQRYIIQKKYFGKYDEWLDRCEHGQKWLNDEGMANVVTDKIHSMDRQRYSLFAYCIMPNHVHLLINPFFDERINHQGATLKYPVADTLRLLKGSTARECNLKLGRTGHFWHRESYDHYARDEEELGRIISYILNNPVKAGLVKEWKEWAFAYVSPDFGTW